VTRHDDPARPRRPLRRDERQLWSVVTRSIAPLPGTRRVAEDPPSPAPPPPPAAPVPTGKPAAPRVVPPVSSASPPGRLERRLKQRISRGQVEIDARIDLHGLTQAEAHSALARFLASARVRGARVVLVITGKGGPDPERGVLRRQVPLWLRSTHLRDHVIGFETAHVGHGGEGALYVSVRRPKGT
jgi:DNA-nicking Smr family endonuclease